MPVPLASPPMNHASGVGATVSRAHRQVPSDAIKVSPVYNLAGSCTDDSTSPELGGTIPPLLPPALEDSLTSPLASATRSAGGAMFSAGRRSTFTLKTVVATRCLT